jgi:uncharacterized protein with GYD domain
VEVLLRAARELDVRVLHREVDVDRPPSDVEATWALSVSRSARIREITDAEVAVVVRGSQSKGLLSTPRSRRFLMFTYVGLFRLTPVAREHLVKTPEYFEKIHKIVEEEGGTVDRFLAIMGPWEYFGIFEYPDLEAAFRVLGKIAKLEWFETETFPAEDVKLFWKALV